MSTIQSGFVQLKIHNTVYTVTADVPSYTSLNTYIRDYANLKGTKFMCLEGGCGACIVAVKRKNPVTGNEEVFAVNSCLVPVFSCHGWHIITIEGLGNQRDGYHKIQSTLAGFSGSQCGFCSPGMIMNMYSLLESGEEITMEKVQNSFGGNLCRCTGYRSILDAFKSLAKDATPELRSTCADIEDVMSQLKICSKTKKPCNNACKLKKSELDLSLETPDVSFTCQLQHVKWFRITDIKEIYEIFKSLRNDTTYMIVAGNTAQGVYKVNDEPDIYIDVNAVKDLKHHEVTSNGIELGANMSLSCTMKIFKKLATESPNNFAYLERVANHIDLIANVPVRNMGTLAGNLSIKHKYPDFPSDLFLLLTTVNAKLTIGYMSGTTETCSLTEFLAIDMRFKVILSIMLPILDSSSYIFGSYKIMQRAQNTHAYVNAGFLMNVNKGENFKIISPPSIVVGGINPNFVYAKNTQEYLFGKRLLDLDTLKKACQIFKNELNPDDNPTKASSEYRSALAVNLFYKFVLSLSPDSIGSEYRSGGWLLKRPVSFGKQDYQTDRSIWPVNKPMPKLEAFTQCAGEAEFVNDIPSQFGELHGAFVVAKNGPGELLDIDTSALENIPGVVKFLSAKDIPGRNTYVEVEKIEDEELFAEKKILYAGQPVGVVIATSQILANKAADMVVVNVKQSNKPALNLKAIVDSGDTSRITKQCEKLATEYRNDIKYKFNGSFTTGGQFHFPLETQSCYCVPIEDGINIFPSSQWIAAVQYNAAAALNLSENCVNVSVRRIGGGFGSKERRSALVSTACAVAAHNLRVPVRMIVKLETNMEAIGKRFPMHATYEGAVDDQGRIQFLNINTYTDRGVTANDRMESFIVHYTSKQYDNNTWTMKCFGVRTDLASNTYCRAPGSTEGIALIENIMEHIANITNKDPVAIRLTNLNTHHSSSIADMINDIQQNSDINERKESIKIFNKENRWKKRGISLVAMNFPFSVKMHCHVLLSVYAFDGSIAISHGGIEVGQGINTKVAQACAYHLGIDTNMVKIKPANSLVSPNDWCTSASSASDAATFATIECCKILLKRLEPIRQENPDKSWPELIAAAYVANVDLCCEFMYSPTASYAHKYDIFGVTVSEVEVDILTGQYQILRVDILEDLGQSISPDIDVGQVEGAFVMGLGYWLTEKLVYDENTGALLTNRTWNYTVPSAKDIPIDFRVYFRRNAPNPTGILRSKAVGEPPLCMSIGVVYAIRNALFSARKDAGSTDNWFEIKLPFTPENVYLSSMTSIDQFAF